MRIGINIPNGLHGRLKAINEPINVSEVCRDAIESVVLEHDELAARVEEDNLGEVVAAFADDGEQWSDIDWRKHGWTDARDWFKKVNCEQYDRFVYEREFYLRGNRSSEDILRLADWATHIDGIVGFHDRMNQHRDLEEKEYDRMNQWALDGSPRQDAAREYKTAWLAYFNVVYRLIENTRKQQAEERLRSFAQFPTPELPEHLV